MKIGVFDSGIGGITVLEKAIEMLPSEDFIFYADTAHVPYGTKSEEEIRCYLDEVVSFMLAHNVEILVLACNTATSAAVTYLRNKYDLEILGMEPAVKVAKESLKENKQDLIIVSATDLTLRLQKLENLIHRLEVDEHVMPLSLQQLVNFAENGLFDGKEIAKYIQSAFKDVELKRVCAVVLGCTHFTYYKSFICNYLKTQTGREIPVVDGNEGTVQNLVNKVKERMNPDLSSKKQVIQFFESGKLVNSKKYLDLLALAHKENSRGC